MYKVKYTVFLEKTQEISLFLMVILIHQMCFLCFFINNVILYTISIKKKGLCQQVILLQEYNL